MSHNSYQGVEDVEIDATRFMPLRSEEKKIRFEENLCLYCGEAIKLIVAQRSGSY